MSAFASAIAILSDFARILDVLPAAPFTTVNVAADQHL